MRFTTTASCTVEQAFAVAADLAAIASWDPFTRRGEVVAGEPLALGSEYRLDALGGLTMRYRLVEVDPPRLALYRGGTKRVTSTDRVEVTPAEDGCSVAITSGLEFTGWTVLISPLVRGLVWLGARFVSLPALRRHLSR
jgi:hypothetical protein